MPISTTSVYHFQPGGSQALPPGVTLQQIDGGPTFYADNGFTYAAAAGWDSPSFFPVGLFEPPMHTQADADRWLDLGLNTSFTYTGDSVLSLFGANGVWVVGSGVPGEGAETTGLSAYDEPSTMADWEAALQSTANSIQDHRFWWLNNTWNFIAYGDIGGTPAAQVYSTQVITPNGSTRTLSLQSCDTYWIAGSTSGPLLPQLGIILGLGRDATVGEARRGCWYGDMVDDQRAQVPGVPILQFVENGGPYVEDTTAADYMTPPELNWSVWSSVIHGARYLCYFNHSFAGPGGSDDNLAESYYQTIQSGQSVSIYAQTKATNTLIAQLARVINSPSALGYVSVTPSPGMFSGIDAAAKYCTNGGPPAFGTGNGFYIFAITREALTAVNINATFTCTDGYSGPVAVIGESRTVTSSGGVFSDTFAQAWTVHIYRVPG